MKLGLRLLLGFFLITGLAAFLVLRVFVQEVRPSVREVMEDLLVDTAHILAELARDDLARLPPGGDLSGSAFARAVSDYAARPVQARIWGLDKRTLDYRVYVTDARGRVVYDSGDAAGRSDLGEDYSQWRDVARTLRGDYGARASREVAAEPGNSVMYVAAPVRQGGRILGVLTVAKPMRTVQPFVERAERKILVQGAWLLGLSLLIGVAVTAWIVWSVRRLRGYAQRVQAGRREEVPALSGELGELAHAMAAMRERLENRRELEHTVRALTHELKSPMAAIAGAAELLHDDLPAADRQLFAAQIQQQVLRQRSLVDRLLELSKLEQRRTLDHAQRIDLRERVQAVVDRAAARLAQAGLRLNWPDGPPLPVMADPEALELALGNLLDNAIDFAPPGSAIDVAVQRGPASAEFLLRDHGPGVPDFALARLGERFFSTARPARGDATPAKGTGLGLALVREVVALHRGSLAFEPAAPGLRVRLSLPLG